MTTGKRNEGARLHRALAVSVGLLATALAWSPPERISHPPPGWIATEPDIAVGQDGRVHVIWTQWRGPYTPQYLHYTCRSDTWTTPVCISRDSFGLISSAIAVDAAGTIVVVWSNADDYVLRYSVPVDDTWASPEPVLAHQGTIPRLAADGRNQVDVLFDGLDGIWHSIYASDEDTWATPRLVASGPASLSWQDLAIDHLNRRHAVWMDYGTYGLGYAHGDGTIWSEPVPLPDPAPSGQSCDPRIATDDSNRPHVVWEERLGGPNTIYHSVLVGDTRSTPFQVNTDGDCYSPVIRSDGHGNVHVVWRAILTGWSGLMHRFRRPDGQWSSAETVSNMAGWPELARSDDGLRLYLTWCTGTPERQTYFCEETLTGAVTEQPQTSRSWSTGPVIGVGRSGLVLGFHQVRAGPVMVVVTDASGRVLSTTDFGLLPAGQQRLWLPTGGVESCGVRLVTVRACGLCQTSKVVLIK